MFIYIYKEPKKNIDNIEPMRGAHEPFGAWWTDKEKPQPPTELKPATARRKKGHDWTSTKESAAAQAAAQDRWPCSRCPPPTRLQGSAHFAADARLPTMPSKSQRPSAATRPSRTSDVKTKQSCPHAPILSHIHDDRQYWEHEWCTIN